MGFLDNFVKNIDDTLGKFEDTVKKIDGHLDATVKNAEKKVAAVNAVAQKIDTTSEKVVEVFKSGESKIPPEAGTLD